MEAARRELKEETNLDLVRWVSETPFEECYQFIAKEGKVIKKVSYFVAEVTGEVLLQKGEIQAGRWVHLPEAIEQLTYKESRSILSQVRHALYRT
jgi:8-oxo-dGTP pyrophosphatase MutT (NUDIX family)